MSRFYDPDGNRLTLETWAEMIEDIDERVVAQSKIGDIVISTVWLGLDHNWTEQGPPHIYETMILGGDDDGQLWRHSTREQAFQGHINALALVAGDGH